MVCWQEEKQDAKNGHHDGSGRMSVGSRGRLESLVSCKLTSKDISLCEARVVPDVMGSVLEGGLSQQEVVSELKPLLPKMNKCYEQSIDRGNVESGSVVLEWTIAGNGEVQKLMWNREKSTSDDSQLSRCMTSW